MCVVECGCETKEGDYGCEFVQDEERGYVGERCGGEGGCVFVQEFGEAPVEAVDAGRGGRWWCRVGCEGAADWWVAKLLCLAPDDGEELSLYHGGRGWDCLSPGHVECLDFGGE